MNGHDGSPAIVGKLRRILGRDWPWTAAVLLVAFIAAWPAMAQPGLLNTRGGGDSPFLLQRLHQLMAALAGGHFPARWMPDANYGYGYPFYNFYAPLSIYIAALFRFLGFSFVRAIHLAQLAGFVVAGLGMFHLGQRWLGSRWGGLLAAVAYTVAPFHMVNVYVRGDSLAEFWAMAFYPLILLAADGVVAGEKGRKGEREKGGSRPATVVYWPVALFALAYAGLILSHNISALIFSPFVLLYLVIRLFFAERRATWDDDSPGDRRPSFRAVWPAAAGLLLAFALAAWFFLPALAEKGLAQLGPVTEGYFHFSNHFRGRDLVQGGLLFNYDPDGGVAFRLGLIQMALALAGAVAWRLAERAKGGPAAQAEATRKRLAAPVVRRSTFVIFSALVAVFMITPLARPLWDHLPLLSFAQFPWRFLSIASFFLALLAGGVVLVADQPVARAAIALTGSLVLLAAGLLGLRTDYLILTDADVTAERLSQYEWFTGNIGTTVSAEYLTPESAPRPWAGAWLNAGTRDRAVAVAGQMTAELVERDVTRQTWQIVAGEDGTEVLFPTMYWPGWRATVDGEEVELRPYPSSGLMALTVPAGEHVITLRLGRTPVRLAAEVLSLAAFAVTIGLMVFGRARMIGREQASRRLPIGLLRGLLVIAAGLLLAAFLWRGDPDELPAGDLTWDFAQMGYLHHAPGGIGFTDGARLHSYGYSADEIAAGQTVTVTLSLTPGKSASAELALVTPAAARPTPDGTAEPPALATRTIDLTGETAVFHLPIAADAPVGLYVPRFIIDGARPLTPSGVPRGDLYLRPIRVTAANEGDGPETESQPVELVAASVAARDATTLDGRFTWLADPALGRRYLLSWRLQNGDGLALSQLDTQPGYGFNPTDGWPGGQPVNDWLALRLPDALTGPPPYPLVVLLYDATTGEPVLLRRVGQVVEAADRLEPRPVEPVFAPPRNIAPLVVDFGDDDSDTIRLRGYKLEQTDDGTAVTLYWETLGDIPADYTRFVHLIDASDAVVAQVDGHPAGNSYPTGQWVAGEIVADTIRFDAAAVPTGEYRLATGFYRAVEGLPRLAATTPDGPLPDGRAILPENLIISPPR